MTIQIRHPLPNFIRRPLMVPWAALLAGLRGLGPESPDFWSLHQLAWSNPNPAAAMAEHGSEYGLASEPIDGEAPSKLAELLKRGPVALLGAGAVLLTSLSMDTGRMIAGGCDAASQPFEAPLGELLARSGATHMASVAR